MFPDTDSRPKILRAIAAVSTEGLLAVEVTTGTVDAALTSYVVV